MALQTILENLDNIPDALKGEYEEKDVKMLVNGKAETVKRFVLNLIGIDSHPSVVNLKSAHETVKSQKAELSTKYTDLQARLEGLPDDFNAETYQQLKDAAEGKGVKPTDEQLQEARRQATIAAENKARKEIEKRDTRIQQLDSHLQRYAVEGELRTQLIEVGVDPKFIPATLALLRNKGNIKINESDNQFTPQVETDMGPVSIKDYVKDWAAQDEGKAFVTKPSGGGASGNNGNGGREDNPFDTKGGKRKVNHTELQEFVKTDPARAKELAKQAGWSDAQIYW